MSTAFGTFALEERIGCLQDEPSPVAQSFIENMEGFFNTLQPLLYNLPTYKIYKNKLYREFESYNENILDIGQSMIEKVNDRKGK